MIIFAFIFHILFFFSVSFVNRGWWVGRAEKWRSQFLGEDWRCGV